MHDFSCSNPDNMHYKILADKTRYFKEDEKGIAEMLSLGKIAKYAGLTLEQVKELSQLQTV